MACFRRAVALIGLCGAILCVVSCVSVNNQADNGDIDWVASESFDEKDYKKGDEKRNQKEHSEYLCLIYRGQYISPVGTPFPVYKNPSVNDAPIGFLEKDTCARITRIERKNAKNPIWIEVDDFQEGCIRPFCYRKDDVRKARKKLLYILYYAGEMPFNVCTFNPCDGDGGCE